MDHEKLDQEARDRAYTRMVETARLRKALEEIVQIVNEQAKPQLTLRRKSETD